MEKIIIEGTFDNVAAKKDGTATVKFKFPASEIVAWSKLLLCIDKPLICMLSANGEKIKMGTVYFKNLSIDREGEAKFTIDAEMQQIEFEKLIATIETSIKVMFKTLAGEVNSDE